jgi:hypothetical protein
MNKYKRSHNSGKTGLPLNRLSGLEHERWLELTGDIDPMDVQKREIMVQHVIKNSIFELESGSPLLSRIGAYTFLFSQIESRVRAMYRQRYAVMIGGEMPKPVDEDDELESEPNNYSAIDSYEFAKAVMRLKEYDDIDSETVKDLQKFTSIRNKMIHQAVYRLSAFKPDIFVYLADLYDHMVRVRNRMTTRVKKDRKLFFDNTQDAIRNLTTDIAVNERVTRERLFERLGGSVTLSVPIVNMQPLYIVAKPYILSTPIQVTLGDEYSTHTLWNKVLIKDTKYLVFRKVPFTSDATVEKLGYGTVVPSNANGEYIINIVE